ncbi:MAG TPA: hypothetical protein VFE50_16140 [Cyclobacteriaceae bacterium]|nr:hypothetical protein [Cyclobacteriaceae bacterium]
MRKLFVLLAVVALVSCKDDDPKFSSAEGNWTYTTPDGKISIDFTLVKSGTTWSVTNESITVDGTKGMAAVTYDNINPPTIGSIRINANDTKLTYPYYISFSGTVSDDFKEIKGPGATYTWPQNKTNQLTDITISRK